MATPTALKNSTVPHPNSAQPVIEARGLRKRYGDFEAVCGIDFTVERGQCFGFLGPNGAGKSTTMRMIYRATPLGGGTMRILGHDVDRGQNDRAIKRRLGVVAQDYNLDERLSARENLLIFARFYGLYGRAAARRVDELLAFAALSDRPDAVVETLSGGLKRRVQIARGLLGDPEILVLDEPTTGLDPQVRNVLWDKLIALKRQGTTLVLTTHYMDEAEKLCDWLVIMDQGAIVAQGSPRALIAEHVTRYVVELRPPDAGPSPEAAASPGPNSTNDGANDNGSPAGTAADTLADQIEAEFAARARFTSRLAERILFYTDDGEDLLTALIRTNPEATATLRHATLEDVFVRITGHGLGA